MRFVFSVTRQPATQKGRSMELTDEQFSLIKEQFKTLKERSPFYAKKFEGIDLSGIQTQEDFEKLPFSEKADLREAYPLGSHPFFFWHHRYSGGDSLYPEGC